MSNSLNLRDHKTEAAPKESENIARAYCWLKSERKWKHNAPVSKVLMTFSTAELEALVEKSRGEGMVKLTLTLWKSDFPETSDGWSPDIPEIDDYEKPPQQKVSKEMPSGVSITV
jgi:hypothetical protein